MANILNSQNKDQTFDNGSLKIHDNLISTPTGFIQVANISRVYVAKLPKLSYTLGIIIVLIGLLICSGRYGVVYGLIIAAVGIAFLYFTYQKNQANKYGLFIELNSGNSLIFPSGETEFLYKAANFLANIIEGKLYAQNYSIQFTDNSIHDVNGAVVKGGSIERMITHASK